MYTIFLSLTLPFSLYVTAVSFLKPNSYEMLQLMHKKYSRNFSNPEL